MDTTLQNLQGLWLPLITPFTDGELDETSLAGLVRHYVNQPIDGLVLCATTGEEMTLSWQERERIIALAASTMSELGASRPILMGVSGSDTTAVANALEGAGDWPLDGFLVSCPHYTRPSQAGLKNHFRMLADRSPHPVVIYNIPYRTGVNMDNETMLELGRADNIIGVKDCCAMPRQSYELIRNCPPGFSVLTGEDPFYYNALVHGADGAILATAHLMTDRFAGIRNHLRKNNQKAALALWNEVACLADLLFSEPSPAALKYWLCKVGLISSPELRLPMMPVSPELANKLDQHIEQMSWPDKNNDNRQV